MLPRLRVLEMAHDERCRGQWRPPAPNHRAAEPFLAPCTCSFQPLATWRLVLLLCLEAGDLEAARWRNRRYRHRLLLRSKVFSRIDEPILLEIVLLVVELAIPSIGLEQRFVRAALHNLPALEHQNLIGAANRRQPVRNYERGPSPAQRPQPVLNLGFALGV